MTDNGQVVLTPTARKFARRSLLWVALTVIALLLAAFGMAVSSVTQTADPMSATSPAPNGAKALVEVLRGQGVTVTVTESLADTKKAISDDDTTLFFYDPQFYLDAGQVRETLRLTNDVVVLDPAFEVLEVVSADIAQAGYVEGELDADCDFAPAEVAEDITGDGYGFRAIGDTVDATACFGSGDDVYSLVQVESGDTTYVLLGATSALSNGTILENGNAALGLNLLGANEELVWYIPSAADWENDIPTAAQLSPAWVVPVSLTAFCVALAAMFWRGRRFGPLIVENLPVTVRASETMQGRARLYENSSARLHTLDSLRIGTIARLATACGLPVIASVDEVVLAAAARAGRDATDVRRLLVDARPATDRELVSLSDELLDLERIVAHNSRPH